MYALGITDCCKHAQFNGNMWGLLLIGSSLLSSSCAADLFFRMDQYHIRKAMGNGSYGQVFEIEDKKSMFAELLEWMHVRHLLYHLDQKYHHSIPQRSFLRNGVLIIVITIISTPFATHSVGSFAIVASCCCCVSVYLIRVCVISLLFCFQRVPYRE